MCRTCQIDSLHAAAAPVPEALLEDYFAAKDSVVGRWVQAGTADFVERHLEDLAALDGITTSERVR